MHESCAQVMSTLEQTDFLRPRLRSCEVLLKALVSVSPICAGSGKKRGKQPASEAVPDKEGELMWDLEFASLTDAAQDAARLLKLPVVVFQNGFDSIAARALDIAFDVSNWENACQKMPTKLQIFNDAISLSRELPTATGNACDFAIRSFQRELPLGENITIQKHAVEKVIVGMITTFRPGFCHMGFACTSWHNS